jgi:hypothetical protein
MSTSLGIKILMAYAEEALPRHKLYGINWRLIPHCMPGHQFHHCFFAGTARTGLTACDIAAKSTWVRFPEMLQCMA